MPKFPVQIPPRRTLRTATPSQLIFKFDPVQLQGIGIIERAKARDDLATILMQAAGVVTEENDDDKR